MTPGIRRVRVRRVASSVIVCVETAAGARGFGEACAEDLAVEAAELDATARERGVALAALLADAPSDAVPVNALVATPAEARAAIARGIRTVKLKTTSVEAAVAMRAAIGPGIGLRLDINRRWPLAATLDRLAALRDAGVDVEYVEEPCAETVAIAAQAPVPIALDESLVELADAMIDAAPVAAVILKPTLLGIRRTLAIAARARARGVAPIVTHAFEGPIGVAACAEIARAIGGDRAVGLDRHPGLDAWTTRVPQLGAASVIAARAPGLGLDAATLDADLAAREGLRW